MPFRMSRTLRFWVEAECDFKICAVLMIKKWRQFCSTLRTKDMRFDR